MKIATGFDTIKHNGCRSCRAGSLDGGIGIAAEGSWLKREIYFGSAELTALNTAVLVKATTVLAKEPVSAHWWI